MTAKAIDILQQDGDGFVLMVEGGRIDYAHHAGNAYRALMDAIAFDAAVAKALGDDASREDTLIVVTADHSHSMTMQRLSGARQPDPRAGHRGRGYARRSAATASPTPPSAMPAVRAASSRRWPRARPG